MFIKKYGDIIVSVFFILLSIVMIFAATLLPESTVMEIGPDFMPIVVGIVTLILALALLVLSLINLKKQGAEPQSAAECDYKRMLISLALVLVYVFVLKPLGFIVSTLIYLPIQMYVLADAGHRTKKDIITLLVIDVLFTFVVFFLFRYGFKIVLPQGIFTINL